MQKNIVKKGLVFAVILLFIIPGVTSAFNTDNKPDPLSNGNWLYVGGLGPGNYTRIQDAIDNASNGDTIFVFNGIYNGSVGINKSIYLIGENKNNTVIDGQYNIHGLVTLTANNIYFSGFSIIHCMNWANDYGVGIFSSYNIVNDNIISDNLGGEGGIEVGGNYNQITNNIICNNKRDYSQGILIGYGAFYNSISGNTINDNYQGIWLAANHDNIISGNYIHNNSYEGIMIRGVDYSEISNNIIENNKGAAIRIEWDSSNVVVDKNIIKNNNEGLVIGVAQSLIIKNNLFYIKGIKLTEDELNNWLSHFISNNLINGKPIYYFKSEKGLVTPYDSGQLILVDCSNCTIKDLHISNVDYGIQFCFSNDNNIFSNEFYDNICNCIRLYASSNNNIFDNLIKNNLGTGIVIYGSSYSNTIHDNFIENNKEYGIYLKASENNIYRNNFKENTVGIYIDFSYYNLIFENNFIKNYKFHGTFTLDYNKQHKNKWKSNYYYLNFGLLPKFLMGSVKTRFYWVDPVEDKHYYYRIGFNFDWHPAKEPYNISIDE